MCLQKIEMFIRKSISEEEEAVYNYLERKHKISEMQEDSETQDMYNKLHTFEQVLDDIIAEEQVHIGQLKELLTVFEISTDNELKGKEETTDTYAEVLSELNELMRN